jgi:hypothetical protein
MIQVPMSKCLATSRYGSDFRAAQIEDAPITVAQEFVSQRCVI